MTLIDENGTLTPAGIIAVDALLDCAGIPRRPALNASRQEQTEARREQQGRWRKYKVARGK